jgi:hypothetical protein
MGLLCLAVAVEAVLLQAVLREQMQEQEVEILRLVAQRLTLEGEAVAQEQALEAETLAVLVEVVVVLFVIQEHR